MSCLIFHLGLETNSVENAIVGDVPAGAVAAERVDGSARHGNVLAVELADHVHTSGVGISGLKILWLVDLRIHHVRGGNLASGHADAAGGLVVHGRVGTWHHGLGVATVTTQDDGMSGGDATTNAASNGHHARSGGIAADIDSSAVGEHHGLGTLITLLDRNGHHGSGSGTGLERTSGALGNLN